MGLHGSCVAMLLTRLGLPLSPLLLVKHIAVLHKDLMLHSNAMQQTCTGTECETPAATN